MSLTFPLALADFSDKLGIATLTARQGLQQETSSQGSGDEIDADLSPAKREYDVVLAPKYHDEAGKCMALIESLRGALNKFYITDPRYPAPAADPGGALLLAGSSTPVGGIAAQGDFTTGAYAVDGNPVDAADAESCSRGSTGTYFDSTGTLQTAAANVLRIDYDPTNLVVPGATNLALHSADLTSYLQAFCRITPNAALAPDGSLSMDKIVEAFDSIANFHYIEQTFTVAANTPYVLSAYVQAAERHDGQLYFSNSTFTNRIAVLFDLTTGLTSTSITGSGTILASGLQSVGNGIYRVWVAGLLDAVSTAANMQLLIANNSGGSSYLGDGASGLYVWGVQLETGAGSPTPYIATTTAAVTRAPLFAALGALVEQQSTNQIANNSMTGAVGGSPGTLPTGWVYGGDTAIVGSVTGGGTENGMPYIEITFSGTGSGVGFKSLSFQTKPIAAGVGQVWTGSFRWQRRVGSITPLLLIQEYASGTFLLNHQQNINAVAGVIVPNAITATMTSPTVNQLSFASIFGVSTGAVINETFRVYIPQMERGTIASSAILTTNAAVTRAADVLTLTAVGLNNWTIISDNGISQIIGTAGQLTFNPANLNRPHIATYKATRVAQPGPAAVTINSLNVNNKAMSLAGLPPGYIITRGDFLAWDYGSSPTRRAYFRAAETVTANGSGVTPEFQLSDFIKPGSTTGLAVTLIKPAMKAKLIFGSVQEQAGSTDPMFTNIQFSIRQVL